MGVVYQAWDSELGVAVALKVIRPEVSSDPYAAREVERRFKRELLLARQVTHKHVVRIHDLGEIDGIKYLTMPYIEGRDLAQVLREEGHLGVQQGLRFAKQIADGLLAAHEAGVVHRDLKPENVMIDLENQAQIMDFGISRSVSGGATWASIQSGGAGVTHKFDFVDGRHAWAGQDAGEIVYTLNGGRQWIRATVGGFDAFGKIVAVAFADTSTGWAGGSDAFFGGSNGIVSRSTDGGKTWEVQLVISDFTFNGLEAIDPLTAFAVGGFDLVGGGVVLRTVDGGLFWQDVTPAPAGFRDVFFLDATTGWVGGSTGPG